MTNLEALKARVGYPLSDDTYNLPLLRRGLVATEEHVPSADVEAFELAYADVLTSMVSSPNSVGEGGYSISMGDRKALADIANLIYKKYEEATLIPKSTPTAKFVQRW